MADILIRGISLPEDELKYVSLWVYGDGRVYVINNASAACSRKLQDLAVPLPEGHGRLGDLDALFEKMYHLSDNEGAHKDSHVDDDLILRDSACYLIEKATTIIEADLEWKMNNCCCFSNTDQAEGGGEDG